jgi:hypothetical protein
MELQAPKLKGLRFEYPLEQKMGKYGPAGFILRVRRIGNDSHLFPLCPGCFHKIKPFVTSAYPCDYCRLNHCGQCLTWSRVLRVTLCVECRTDAG